jgi:hypothetical protein
MARGVNFCCCLSSGSTAQCECEYTVKLILSNMKLQQRFFFISMTVNFHLLHLFASGNTEKLCQRVGIVQESCTIYIPRAHFFCRWVYYFAYQLPLFSSDRGTKVPSGLARCVGKGWKNTPSCQTPLSLCSPRNWRHVHRKIIQKCI